MDQLAEETRGETRSFPRLVSALPWAVATASLAVWTTWTVLAKTGGDPAVPLDDAFIHFTYARSFATFRPLVYWPGEPATSGATSLLWPLLLAPFWVLGLRGLALIWPAWGLGWIFLGLLAVEARRASEKLVGSTLAIYSGVLVLAFGGYVWGAGSGMEVTLFGWLMLRAARRCLEWAEGDVPHSQGVRAELWALAIAASLARPEGAAVSLMVAGVLFVRSRGFARLAGLVPLVGPFLSPAIYWLATGSPVSAGAQVKWIPAFPANDRVALGVSVLHNVKLFFVSLLDGTMKDTPMMPQGWALVPLAGLLALAALSWRRRRWWQGACLLALAAGALMPTTYANFAVHRLRYVWPFAAPWLIGLVALAALLGEWAGARAAKYRNLQHVVAGAFALALAWRLPATIADLATSSNGIHRQQVSIAEWAKEKLPPAATIAINDAGAIPYLSDRRTHDIVGLTTRGESRFWIAGPGSRFERFESMPPDRRPTHFIVYPGWLQVPQLLGRQLAERTVLDANILGGPTMVAFEADYSATGAGEQPEREPGQRLDAVDVADLDDERAHDYRLGNANRRTNVLLGEAKRFDGGRSERTLDQFRMKVAPGGTLVARLAAPAPLLLRVRVGARYAGSLEVPARPWVEESMVLPNDLEEGPAEVEVEAEPGKSFTALHYWSYR